MGSRDIQGFNEKKYFEKFENCILKNLFKQLMYFKKVRLYG